jgi:hypothetical protein
LVTLSFIMGCSSFSSLLLLIHYYLSRQFNVSVRLMQLYLKTGCKYPQSVVEQPGSWVCCFLIHWCITCLSQIWMKCPIEKSIRTFLHISAQEIKRRVSFCYPKSRPSGNAFGSK